MAIDARWEDQGGLYRKYSGTLSIEDIMYANLKAMGDHRSDELRYVIADFLDVKRSSIGPDDISKITLFDQPAVRTLRCLKIAFIVRGETQQALAHLYERESRESTAWQCRSFASAEDARSWLAVDLKLPQLALSC